jgi:hypothetical protein
VLAPACQKCPAFAFQHSLLVYEVSLGCYKTSRGMSSVFIEGQQTVLYPGAFKKSVALVVGCKCKQLLQKSSRRDYQAPLCQLHPVGKNSYFLHKGAWSMALVLWQPPEYYYYSYTWFLCFSNLFSQHENMYSLSF